MDELPFGRLKPSRRHTKWILSNAANHIEVLSVLGGVWVCVCVACGRHSAVHEYDKCLRLEGTITTAKVSCCLKAQRSLNGQLITVIRQ